MAARGRFITLEGGEGCGKSTQAALLLERLRTAGVDAILVREPGGTAVGEDIRRILKDPAGEGPCDRCELLLFLAARAQLVRNVVAPALEQGRWVVSDRFCDSTFAYQGFGRGLPLDFLASANAFACEGVSPDLTLLLDLDPAEAAKRLRGREAALGTGPDRMELAGGGFHERLREGFRELARREPGRIAVVDASGPVAEVEERIWKLARPRT